MAAVGLDVRQPRLVVFQAVETAGPEDAARRGVPVGSVVNVREVRCYRNPLRQLWWRLTHPAAGRITGKAVI